MMPGFDPHVLINSEHYRDTFPATMSPTNFSQMNMVMTKFLNSNHPVVRKLREEIERKTLGQLPSSNLFVFKSAQKASLLIDSGDKAFASEEYEEALRYYSESVATAPMDGIELAIAFAKRSGVLCVCKRYNLSLLDVNRALSVGAHCPHVFPVNIKQELIRRKHHCWKKLKTSHQPEAIKNKLECRVRLRADERQVLHNCNVKMNINDTDLKMDYKSFDDLIWRTKFGKATLPGTSSKVLAVEDYPRRPNALQVIATEDINPGEVLFIREYLTVEVRKELRHNVCAYCTLWCEALIPCPTCSREMYCGKSCRRAAYNLYHRTECKVLWLLNDRNTGEPPVNVHFLRLFLTGTRQGADLANLMRDPHVTALMNGPCHNIEIYTFADNYNKYLATLNTLWKICRRSMIFNSDLPDILFDMVARAVNALRSINFFNDIMKSGAPNHMDCAYSASSNLEIFAALLLLQHMRIMSTKCLEPLMGNLYRTNEGHRGVFIPMDIGIGTVNVHNLMNHSCDSNTGLIQNRRRLLIYSLRPILRGQQIYDALAPNYTTETLEERRQTLQARGLECFCEACKNNWPLGGDVLEKKNVYLTSYKDIIKDIEGLHIQFSSGFNPDGSVRQGFSEEIAPAMLKSSIRKIRQNVKQPSATNIMCKSLFEDQMRRKGNFYHLAL